MRRNTRFAVPLFLILLAAAAIAQTLPEGVQKLASVEGMTEYAFPNGLHVLLFPDASKPKVTVNMTYLVGSRHEGYGETGMAHLLEHMVFKPTKGGRDIVKELTDHRAMFNRARQGAHAEADRCSARRITCSPTSCSCGNMRSSYLGKVESSS